MAAEDARELDDAAAGEVAAMQFAGGRSLDDVAAAWERDRAWAEDAVRRALLARIPERDGGLKTPRSEERAEHAARIETLRGTQKGLGFWPEY